MKRKIKLLYVSAEISPYANAGGLGEVGRSLPKALMETGNYEVRRVMPLYQVVKCKLNYITDFTVQMDQGFETCVLKKDSNDMDITTYFITNDRYYFRENIYSYNDDGFRFFFFCKAVVEMLKHISFQPDIIHTNDWHTGFLPLLLKKEFPNIKTVYTIHNISYHGFIPDSYLNGYLKEEEKTKLGYPEWLNFMMAGIIYSDLVTTVSPGYAEEIQIPEQSFAMASMIKERRNGIIGILNGIDTKVYNPNTEEEIPYPYTADCMERKKMNRTRLRESYGLPDNDIPLLAMVTRLDETKGIDLLLKAVSLIELSTFQLIILGSGKPYYQRILSLLSTANADKIVVDFNYSEALAKKIYAAADIYLMPSQLEPCGLGQMYSMRYGAVPIVNPVGGLKDTVIACEQEVKNATGFYMEEWSDKALAKAIRKAIKIYHTKEWKNLVINGMRQEFTWERSVTVYHKYYEELLRDKCFSVKITVPDGEEKAYCEL